MADPALQAKFVERGLVADQTSQSEWSEFAKAELVKWGEVVKRANVKVE
jgi:tripartite-type tricarboxylate transporter receptor subunit TctC